MFRELKKKARDLIDALRMRELFVNQATLLNEMYADTLRQRYADPKRLVTAGYKVYSQGDQDGQIAEIFRRIGVTNRRFVEFGSGDGRVNNGAYLVLQGWSGLWMDAKPDSEAGLRQRWGAAMQEGRVTYRRSFVTVENINTLLTETGFSGEIDLMVIDLDSNDYHIWQAITAASPRVVCMEYNAKFPPPMEWIMPRDDTYGWNGAERFGASLAALEKLGLEKGYLLVGCSLTGVDAFFVRKDLVGDHFAAPFTAENHYQPARYYLNLSSGHLAR